LDNSDSSFLDQYINKSGNEREEEQVSSDGEKYYVTSFTLTHSERERLIQTIGSIKNEADIETSVGALMYLCDLYGGTGD
jgi:hypothetical protein